MIDKVYLVICLIKYYLYIIQLWQPKAKEKKDDHMIFMSVHWVRCLTAGCIVGFPCVYYTLTLTHSLKSEWTGDSVCPGCLSFVSCKWGYTVWTKIRFYYCEDIESQIFVSISPLSPCFLATLLSVKTESKDMKNAFLL